MYGLQEFSEVVTGQRQTISRDALLDHVKAIVRNDGSQALTINTLAKFDGLSTGVVQYSFSSKTELVSALIDRWTERYNTKLTVSHRWVIG